MSKAFFCLQVCKEGPYMELRAGEFFVGYYFFA